MPEGSSAYDLYKRLKAGGLIPMTRDRLNAEVLPKLVAQGDALLKQRYQGTDLTSSEMDELVRIYEWAADLNSQDEAFLARLNYAAGFRALSKGSDQEALTELQRAIRNDSQWALPFYDLARFYARLGNDAYAMYYYQQATQLDPGWVAPQLNLARLHFDADRLGEAELAYRQAAQADPTLATPWYFLGQVYQRQKRKVEAAAAFEKAIELAQQNPPAGFSMEQVRSLLDETRRR
jgi:tetratricopeptide (TPR) repeat protein